MATLRLFAQARELAGTGTVSIDADTVGEILDQARSRFGPDFDAVLSNSRIWLNGSAATTADPVAEADEVAVLPPVSGG